MTKAGQIEAKIATRPVDGVALVLQPPRRPDQLMFRVSTDGKLALPVEGKLLHHESPTRGVVRLMAQDLGLVHTRFHFQGLKTHDIDTPTPPTRLAFYRGEMVGPFFVDNKEVPVEIFDLSWLQKPANQELLSDTGRALVRQNILRR